ncbi:uncharacterized protein LOC134661681 [Cydia amplana]|uniref:uncharacterized protein LOC134659763 n=1 Tax=Cydia amplana TaxID=1869771 RepID=UPI002FE628AE
MKIKEDYDIYELIEQENRDSFMAIREENRKKAKEQILQIQDENRRNYNKRRKPSTLYTVGDRVAIKRTQFGVGMKLKPKFLGPYEVVGCMGRDRYRVKKLDSAAEGPGSTTASCDNMKPWPGEE